MNKVRLFFGISALLASSAMWGQTVQRTPLYETFTSSTCPPCLPGNVHLEGLLDDPVNEGKYTSLKYQMNWPGTGDPYYTTECGNRRGFYSVNSVPRLLLDGGFNEGPTGLTQSMMDDAYEVPSVLALDAYYQVDVATKKVDIQVDMEALEEIAGTGGLFLRVAIFEKHTTGNVKSNGETQFEHVMKKMLPNASGTYLGTVDAGETRSYDFTYTFAGDYTLPPNADSPIDHASEHSIEEFTDLGVVVWVQRTTTREVYQSTYALAGTASIGENTTANSDQFLSVYPNPTSNLAQVVFKTGTTDHQGQLIVTDFAGKTVLSQNLGNLTTFQNTAELSTESLENGIYFVTIRTENAEMTKKLSVLH